MYNYLFGQLAEKAPAKITLDVQGVGYEIRIPVSTFSKLPALGEKVKILIQKPAAVKNASYAGVEITLN